MAFSRSNRRQRSRRATASKARRYRSAATGAHPPQEPDLARAVDHGMGRNGARIHRQKARFAHESLGHAHGEQNAGRRKGEILVIGGLPEISGTPRRTGRYCLREFVGDGHPIDSAFVFSAHPISHRPKKRDMFRLVEKAPPSRPFHPLASRFRKASIWRVSSGALARDAHGDRSLFLQATSLTAQFFVFLWRDQNRAPHPFAPVDRGAVIWATISNGKPFEAAKRRRPREGRTVPGGVGAAERMVAALFASRRNAATASRPASASSHRAAAPRSSNKREPRFRPWIPHWRMRLDRPEAIESLARVVASPCQTKRKFGRRLREHGAPRQGRKPDPERYWTPAPAPRSVQARLALRLIDADAFHERRR